MPAWNSFSYFYGPLCAFIGVGALALILRWTFARGKSVVAAAPRPGASDQYGMLVPVARPATTIEGEMLRSKLQEAGVRANLAVTLEGPRVMVWPADLERAAQLLRNSRPEPPRG
ncbi:MAG TPA: hypothetical protein DDY88_09600 [Actinobacteria bacterium]|nr:hypothetical protein [Actinomycetota bacterium]